MNTSILKSMLLIGLLSMFGSPAWSDETAGGVEKAVAALERQWLEASRANNPDLYAPLLADAGVFTYPDGTARSKAEAIAFDKTTKFTSVEESDAKVMAFGDAAIATGVIRAKGIESGKPWESAWRYTDTWVKMPNGQWLCVASHSSPVAM